MLVVCNACRSQMTAAFNHFGERRNEVRSAGSAPADVANPARAEMPDVEVSLNPYETPADRELSVKDEERPRHYEMYFRVASNGQQTLDEAGRRIVNESLTDEPPEPWQSHCKPSREQQLKEQRDEVYRERSHLIAHLASLYPSHIGYTDPTTPDLAVVIIKTPAGQMSWHITPRDMALFEHVPRTVSGASDWDGHTTKQKYERLRALTLHRVYPVNG